jgi:hypothetical protein
MDGRTDWMPTNRDRQRGGEVEMELHRFFDWVWGTFTIHPSIPRGRQKFHLFLFRTIVKLVRIYFKKKWSDFRWCRFHSSVCLDSENKINSIQTSTESCCNQLLLDSKHADQKQ